MEEKKIIGYRKFTSKAGKECLMCDCVQELSERDKASGAVGQKCCTEFIPESCWNLFVDDKCIGKTLVCHYTISGGRAYLDKVEIK